MSAASAGRRPLPPPSPGQRLGPKLEAEQGAQQGRARKAPAALEPRLGTEGTALDAAPSGVGGEAGPAALTSRPLSILTPSDISSALRQGQRKRKSRSAGRRALLQRGTRGWLERPRRLRDVRPRPLRAEPEAGRGRAVTSALAEALGAGFGGRHWGGELVFPSPSQLPAGALAARLPQGPA